jgi:phosphoglycolate phosphatase-like HAD superfamily hydrolase
MLIIFDVDGTLVGGESHDWASFDQAIASVIGFQPTPSFFSSLPEITGQAIVEAAIRAANRALGAGLEELVRDDYLRRLRGVHADDPKAFPARNGVAALLAHLNSLPDVDIAIATGDWHDTISFKLAAAGLDVSNYPMATSSDVSRRSEIIRLAAQRANRSLTDAVYVGDGVWDVRACRELGVPFIGTGARLDHLQKAGAQYLVEVFEAEHFVTTARTAVRNHPHQPHV